MGDHTYKTGDLVWAWQPFYDRWEPAVAGKVERSGNVFAAGRWCKASEIRPRIKDASAEIARLRATLARIRAICAVEYDAAYDLRADILAEIGGES